MTLKEVYFKGKKILEVSGNESYSFDAMCIFESCFSVNKINLIINGSNIADEDTSKKFFKLIERRASGEPLQYILGKWQFMGLDFCVGKGVLIPRDDTEVLVRETVERIKNIKKPNILDLCAGSGAVSIGIKSIIKDALITSVELSERAILYLKRNIDLNNMNKNIFVKKADVFKDYTEFKNCRFDAIVSNPPYIPSKDIKNLQIEVKSEPIIALDGGLDGLDFYRIITRTWKKLLKPGGLLAVEIGINQQQSVCELFYSQGFKNIEKINDINDICRVVLGFK